MDMATQVQIWNEAIYISYWNNTLAISLTILSSPLSK